MSIRFSCQYCKAVLKVPDSAAGKQGLCPTCKHTISAPITSIDESSDTTFYENPVDIVSIPAKKIEDELVHVIKEESIHKFCRGCGKPLIQAGELCTNCGMPISGTNIIDDSSLLVSYAKINNNPHDGANNIWQAFLIFILNPNGGIQKAHDYLDSKVLITAGLIYGFVYAFFLMLGSMMLMNSNIGLGFVFVMSSFIYMITKMTGSLYFNIFFIGLLFFGGLLLANMIIRVLFKGEGSFANALFCAGITLLPVGLTYLFIGVLSLLPLKYLDFVMVVSIIIYMSMILYTFLAIYWGLKGIFKFSQNKITFALPVLLLLWLFISVNIINILIIRR